MDSHARDPKRVYLGWQYALLHPDPGPPPRRPTPPEQHRVHPEWMDAQRREESQLNRPLKFAAAMALVMAMFLGLLGWPFSVIPGWGAAVAIGICLVLAGVAGYAIWQGEQALRVRLAEERGRLERLRTDRERRVFTAQEEHARRFDAWRARKAAYDAQHEWYAVGLPSGVHRIEVVGGTLAGWSAMTTTMGVTCMDAGSHVTVVDLSEGAIASDLVEVATARQVNPQVWVLPKDVAELDLGLGLDAEAWADVLSLLVSVSEEQGSTRDRSADNAILERILELFDGKAGVAQVTAALRALAQIGDARDDIERGLLTHEHVDRLGRMFGRGASDRVVYERAWALESQLRKLDDLGTGVLPDEPSQLRVIAMDRQGGTLGNTVLGTYVVTALTHELRRGAQRDPWSRVLFVCGAEKLRGDVLDRLSDACESSGTGLIVMYRSIPTQVKERLGRGNSAVAFMRLGNADDAKVASEHIGTEHRFVLNQLTESIGTSVTDTTGDSYTSTQGTSDSVANSTSTTDTKGRGSSQTKSHEGPWGWLDESSWSFGKERNWSRGKTEGRTLTEGVNASTSWGRNTTRALGSTESISRTMQRSREFMVEQHELQRLPASAFIMSYHAASGRSVVCGDANPAIVALPQATHRDLEEVRQEVGVLPPIPALEPHSEAVVDELAPALPWGTDRGNQEPELHGGARPPMSQEPSPAHRPSPDARGHGSHGVPGYAAPGYGHQPGAPQNPDGWSPPAPRPSSPSPQATPPPPPQSVYPSNGPAQPAHGATGAAGSATSHPPPQAPAHGAGPRWPGQYYPQPAQPGADGAPPPADTVRPQSRAEDEGAQPAAEPPTPGPKGTPSREELEDLPPNLGPPPERLDWRKGRD